MIRFRDRKAKMKKQLMISRMLGLIAGCVFFMLSTGLVFAVCNGTGGNNTSECGYRVPAGQSSIKVNGQIITRRGNAAFDEFIPPGAANAPVSPPPAIVFQVPPDFSWEYNITDGWSEFPASVPGLYFASMNVPPVGSSWSL